MTNTNLKSKMLEICDEIERKDESMREAGRNVVHKLVEVKNQIKKNTGRSAGINSPQYDYPVDSVNNILKNIEILTLELEEVIEDINIPPPKPVEIPDKDNLLTMVEEL